MTTKEALRAAEHWTWEEGATVITPFELQSQYLDDVWRYVSARLDSREDAEDVTMDVMASAFKRINDGAKVEKPRLWLLGIARRRVADMLRRKYRRREVPLEGIDAAVEPGNLERHSLNSVLDELSDDHSQALVLKYVNGLSTEEIAVVMERTRDAANSLLQRAREAFRKAGSEAFPDLAGVEEER